VLEGHDCADLAAMLGTPDQTSSSGTAGASSTGSASAEATTRYTWEPASGDPYVRTIVTCAGGRVTHVERINAR
jgi:hypothetical protein